jgi:hypothetical protein
MRNFSGPIPGQSLTTPPKGFPWERPPEIVDPEEAIQMHLARLSDPEMLEGVLDLIELDNLDLKTITNGVMRGAVSQGMHSIDVALLVAPVVHEFIKQGAIAFGLNPEDGFDDKEEKAEYKNSKNAELAKKMIKEMGKAPQETAKEVKAVAVEKKATAEKPKGLMSRGEV